MQDHLSISNQQANKKNTGYNSKQRTESSFFLPGFIQPKLIFNQPNDIYEHQADVMADKVMPLPVASSNNNLFFKPAISSIQRKCAHCEEEEKHMQRKENNNSEVKASSGTEDYVNNLSGGRALSKQEKSFFEPRIGYDLSSVRLHTGSDANASASNINALAYTTGNNIVFGHDQYNSNTESGKRLLAHELTHVVQQSGTQTHGMVQRQAPAGGIGSVVQRACQTPESIVVQTTESEMFDISDVKKPCYACPNSPPDACPKLAQEIFPPVATGPVQFSWQVRFLTVGEGKIEQKTHVIQKVEKTFNFSTPPAAAYNYTSPYWEAFALQGKQSEIDYWQFEIPDLTAGTWELKGTLYLTDQLPNGMAVGNVLDAQGAPSIAIEPDALGRTRGTRRITGRFDFTGTDKVHSFQ